MAKVNRYRELFNGIEVKIQLDDGRRIVPINFDNAATTPPLKQVDQFIYENILMYGSVGRGGHKSWYCTHAYEVSREEILSFFGVSPEDDYENIYVKNTTEGINLLAHILCDSSPNKMLTTRMEHHANDLPWRQMATPYYCEVDEQGKLSLEDIEMRLKRAQGTIKYVAVTGASNVLGYITPIHKIARLAHQHGALIIVDAAQLVGHRKINIKGTCKEEEIDFLVCSGHKMYAPFGSGVVIGKRRIFEKKAPFLRGGGTVSFVLDDDVYYKPSPYKDEAGTPNYLGVMSMVAATTALRQIGFLGIEEHESILKNRLLQGLRQLSYIQLYGDPYDKQRLGVISFNIEGIHHQQVGTYLQDLRGIAVRTGCFCAQPYVMRLLNVPNEERYKYIQNPKLKTPGMVRASFGLYNTEEEVDEFLNVIEHIGRTYRK